MLKGLLSVFTRSNCPLCQRSADICLCRDCLRQLQSSQLKNCSEFWRGDLPLFAWGIYGGQLKRSLAVLKYENCPQLGELMGCWLGKAWLKSPIYAKTKKVTVVPIPLHPKKLKQRGYNQAELIARSFCRLTGYSLQPQGLERVRETKALYGLSVEQRKDNLKSAFVVGKDFQRTKPRSPILLIDDIYTTGTTVTEASKKLISLGIQVWGVAALSRTVTIANNKNSQKNQSKKKLKNIK